MKQICIKSYFKKMFLFISFFICFNQNASVEKNMIRLQNENYFNPSSELNKLFNSKWFVYGGVTVLTVLSMSAIGAFIKYLFFDNSDKKNQALEKKINGISADFNNYSLEINLKFNAAKLKEEELDKEIIGLKKNQTEYDTKINNVEKAQIEYNTKLTNFENQILLLEKEQKTIIDNNTKNLNTMIAECLKNYTDSHDELKKLFDATKDKIDQKIIQISDQALVNKTENQRLINDQKIEYQNMLVDNQKQYEAKTAQLEENYESLKGLFERHTKKYEEEVAKYNEGFVRVHDLINTQINALKKELEENKTANLDLINKKIEEYQKALEDNKKEHTETINSLLIKYQEQVRQIEEDITKKHEEGFKLQKRLVETTEKNFDLQQKIYEEGQSKNTQMKEFAEKNKQVIKEISAKIKIICDEIAKNDTEKNNFYEDFITINNIKNQEMFNEVFKNEQDILSFVLNVEVDNYKKNDNIDVSTLVDCGALKTEINNLISEYKKEYYARRNNPERHSVYKKNQQLVFEIINKYNAFVENISGDRIDETNNTIYCRIIELNGWKDSSDKEEQLFKNVNSILGVGSFNDLDEVYQYLSKDDKVELKRVVAAVEAEIKKRAKNPARQYQWWLNKDDNKNKIEGFKKDIIEICDKINSNKVGDYTTYEEFKKKDIQSLYQLLLFCDNYNFKINEQIENEQEIIAVLLSEQYNKFQYSMEQEEKRRKNNPNRNSIYEKNKNIIASYIEKLEQTVKDIVNIGQINEQQNKLYETLALYIDFDSNFDCSSFIDKSKGVLEIKFNSNVEDFVNYLSNEEKGLIKKEFEALKKEKKERKRDAKRHYQSYINANQANIKDIKSKIADVEGKIKNNKNNQENDTLYQQYYNILKKDTECDRDILKKIIDGMDIVIEIDKIVSCYSEELQSLKKSVSAAEEERQLDPEKCYIANKNQEKINQYYNKMDEFCNKLANINVIDEKVNDDYNKMVDLISDKMQNDHKMIFFAKTVELFDIQFEQILSQDVFKILNNEHKGELNSYINAIGDENNKRKLDESRQYNWYVNKIKISEHINSINQLIDAFCNASEKEDNEVFDKENEDLYMLLLNKNKDIEIVKILFEKINRQYNDTFDCQKLIYHIKIDLLKQQIKKEQEKRLDFPARSPLYKDIAQDVSQITEVVNNINRIWGNFDAEATDESNKAFDFLSSKMLVALESSIDAELFFKILCDSKNKNKNIWRFLSRSQIESVSNLLINFNKESILRKSFASRGLTKEYKDILKKYRIWLKKQSEVLQLNVLSSQATIIKMLGVGARAFQDPTVLFEHLLVIFLKDSEEKNNQDKNYQDKDIKAISKCLDMEDKESLNQLQVLLIEADKSINNNKEALEKEKRIRDNLLTYDKMSTSSSSSMIFNDGDEAPENSSQDSIDCISYQDIWSIPRSIIKYAFIVKINKKLTEIKKSIENAIKNGKTGEVIPFMKALKDHGTLKPYRLNSDLAPLDIESLFNTLQEIDNKDDMAFLESLYCAENFNTQAVKGVLGFLDGLINGVYSVEKNKVHYIFYGPPGTGKTSFMQHAIIDFINNIKNQLLRDYLKKNVCLYKIAKSDYQTGSSLSNNINGLFQDISTLAEENLILFVQMDEIDDLIKKKELGNTAEEVNMLLTLTQRIDFFFSLVGTTNLNKHFMEEAVSRSGRCIAKNFMLPTIANINEYMMKQEGIKETIINSIYGPAREKYEDAMGLKLLSSILFNWKKNSNNGEKYYNAMKKYLNKEDNLIYSDIDRIWNNIKAFKIYCKNNTDLYDDSLLSGD